MNQAKQLICLISLVLTAKYSKFNKKEFFVITLKKKFSDITRFVYNKKVIVRVDLNLPYFEGKVSDFTRVERVIPTIDFLLKNKAKIILISHFGRPKR